MLGVTVDAEKVKIIHSNPKGEGHPEYTLATLKKVKFR